MNERKSQPDIPTAESHSREDIAKILSLSPRDADLLDSLKFSEQYFSQLETLGFYGLLEKNGSPIKPPSLISLVKYFHLGLLETSQRLNKPVLILDPPVSFASKIRALDSHKSYHLHRGNSVIGKELDISNGSSDDTKDWHAYFVDGYTNQNPALGGSPIITNPELEVERDMYRYDSPSCRLSERLSNRERQMSAHFYERGINANQYILLMMQALKDGMPIDFGRYTVLDSDKARTHSRVPVAGFADISGLVGIITENSNIINRNACFRATVGGDTPIK